MPLEPETDITTSAIMWLCDDPTFSPSHHATISEVLKTLGAEDPEDPSLIALVGEGVLATRGEALTPILINGWSPELCGDDAKRVKCSEPVSGTGRCMTCGSQRVEPEKPDTAIKAAQLSDQEPEEIAFLEIEGGQGESAEAAPGEPLLPLDAAPAPEPPPEPRIIHSGAPVVPYRKHKPRRIKRPVVIKAQIHKDAPSPTAIELVRQRVLSAVRSDLPLMHRLKSVTGLSDQELGDIVGRSRATVQAYAQSNRNEVLGPNQLRALGDTLKMHYDVLADLLIELEALQCPSEN